MRLYLGTAKLWAKCWCVVTNRLILAPNISSYFNDRRHIMYLHVSHFTLHTDTWYKNKKTPCTLQLDTTRFGQSHMYHSIQNRLKNTQRSMLLCTSLRKREISYSAASVWLCWRQGQNVHSHAREGGKIVHQTGSEPSACILESVDAGIQGPLRIEAAL